MSVNPYKEKTYLKAFWQFISGSKEIDISRKPISLIKHDSSIIKKDDLWELTFKNQTTLLKDAKGYHDISKLIAEPNKEFHCMELMGSSINEKSATSTIDNKAKSEYQKQIRKITLEIEDAREFNDFEKLEKLQEEYDSLVSYLSQSLGLAGKPRELGSSVEKARSAVTWRIRSAIKKIGSVHPQLAKHLSNSIGTGTFCSYKPELNVNWTV